MPSTFDGPSYLPIYWSCPLALLLWLPCLRLLGSLPICVFFFFFAVLVGFSLGCLHLRCGLGALASRRHGSFVPVGPSLSVFRACFRWGGCRCCCCCCGCPLALRCLFGGQFRSKFTLTSRGGVFCQSAIDSAQNDHANVVQSMLANKEAQLR